MRNILLISEIFPPVHGGSGRWFWELYSRFPQDHCFFAVGNSSNARAFDSANPLNLQRFNLHSDEWGIASKKGLLFYWQLYWQLRKYIIENGIKQLHCGRCLPEGFLGYLLCKTLGLPLLCYIHGEDIEAALTSRELTWIINRVLHHSRILICNSENTANILKNKIRDVTSKIEVIHPGVDSNTFAPKSRDINDRNRLGWGNRRTILTVGRLQKRKGQDMLIKALPLIKSKFPDILYVIVGDGEEKQNLLKLTSNLGVQEHVLFMGEIDDKKLLKCYQQCDLFALPNRTYKQDIEGFGMVLVEAQSCGKAVLSGDSGGTRETMCVGDTGIITDCTNEEGLASELLHLLSDEGQLKKMGAAARKHVLNELDWQALAEKTKSAIITMDKN